ncbi:MAG: sterol desaturase family protein [Syntrophotaleaceae bacterium]
MGFLPERSRKKPRSKSMRGEIPSWLSNTLIFGTLAAVVAAEMKRPLRTPRQDKLRRDVRNISMSLMTAATIALAEKPVVAPLADAAESKRRGLLKWKRLPVGLEMFLSVTLLDYTLYIWHYLTHKVPLLWRFHQVHHVDLDLDASTALRFHAGEMLLSVPWRAAQVALLGISPRPLALWQTLTLAEILFHHSNVRLPLRFERLLNRIIVTPRMHGIHHSTVREETDSNWSTIFSWPDLLHRTLKLNIPQKKVTIGVPAFQNPKELTIGKLLKMPLTVDRPSWRLSNGTRPERKENLPLPRRKLAE